MTEPPTTQTAAAQVIGTLTTLLLPIVTVAGIIVLLALGKIGDTAGLALIGAIVGVHSGVAVARP